MNTSKQINIMILVVFIAVVLTGVYTLWDPNRASEAKDAQHDKVVERGAYLFSQNCRACHGDAGEGGAAGNRLRQAPALNRDDLHGTVNGTPNDVEYANDFKFVYYTITCGRVGKVMPAWGQSQGGTLNDEQIKQLTTMILSGTGWEQAKEFGQRGVPKFERPGDDQYHLSVAQPVAEGDTKVVLNTVRGPKEPGAKEEPPVVLNPNERLSIEDEILLITAVDPDTSTVTVERGVGTTSPASHAVGTEVLKPPIPPDNPSVNERSCGQIAGAQTTSTPEPPSATLKITAKGIAWDKSTLSAIAGVPLALTVDNQDDGTPHDFHLTAGSSPGGAEVPNGGAAQTATQIQNGPVTETLNFGPLDAGDYYYVCDVHPQMEGVLTAYAPGTGPGGGGTPAAGSTTPVPATTPAPVATGTASATTPVP